MASDTNDKFELATSKDDKTERSNFWPNSGTLLQTTPGGHSITKHGGGAGSKV